MQVVTDGFSATVIKADCMLVQNEWAKLFVNLGGTAGFSLVPYFRGKTFCYSEIMSGG